MKLKLAGKIYWVKDGLVEVEIHRPGRNGGWKRSWRKLNPEGTVGKKIAAYAAVLKQLKEREAT